MSNGARFKGVAIGVSSRLQLIVVEIIPVDERIMHFRMKHTLGFMSLIAMYVPTEVCGPDEEDMFYAKLDSVLDQCSHRDTPIVLGDSNAATGTERTGYELCVGTHGSGTRNTNSSLFSELCKKQKVENCRFLVSEIRAAPLDLA